MAVGVGEGLRHRTLRQATHLVQHLAGEIAVQVGEVTVGQGLFQAEHLEEVELQIAEIALVVAHVGALLSVVRASHTACAVSYCVVDRGSGRAQGVRTVRGGRNQRMASVPLGSGEGRNRDEHHVTAGTSCTTM